MTTHELINILRRHEPTADVYVYDERRDVCRVVTSVGYADPIMPAGVVIAIGAALPEDDNVA